MTQTSDLFADPLADQLALLTQDGFVAAVIDAWRSDAGLAPSPTGWLRHYARIRPSEAGWATLVYESADAGNEMVVIQLDRDVRPTDAPEDVAASATITRFPDDPGLVGLAAVVAALRSPQVVRYRHGRRCTLRGVTDGGPRFVKVARTADRLQHDAETIWAASQRGAFSFRVAEPFGFDAATSSFWQGAVPGQPIVTHVLGPDGADWSRRLGAALAEVARAPLVPTATVTLADQTERTWRAARRTCGVFPHLSLRITSVMHHLEQRAATLSSGEPVPVHGAPHVHQWLVDDHGTLGLVDFDRFSMGDPELDIATFLAELETERRRVIDVATLRAAMIDGYEGSGVAIDPHRVDLYMLHKRLSKVTRTAWAFRPDRAARTEHHLARLEADLGRS